MTTVHDPPPGSPDRCPGSAELVTELRMIRRRGLLGLRYLELPAMATAARLSAPGGRRPETAVEALLRAAVAALGDDSLGLAAQYLFGLRQGTVGWPSSRRREEAAGVFERSAETFRKEREKELLDRVATEILRLCEAAPRVPAPRPDPAPAESGAPGDAGGGKPTGPPGMRRADDSPARSSVGVRDAVDRALRHLTPRVGDAALGEHTYGPFDLPIGSGSAKLSVRIGNIIRIRAVDIVVSSENVFMQPAKTYSATLSGSLRRAAMYRDADGRPVDVVAVELARWMADHFPPDVPAPLGYVVPTSPGALSAAGVRRLFHAAVAVPRPGSNSYDTSRDAVQTAVARVFALAREERAQALRDGGPAPCSMSLPLFSSGKGGLTPEQSFGWIWPALLDELVADPAWHVQITVRTARSALAALHGLSLAFEDPDASDP